MVDGEQPLIKVKADGHGAELVVSDKLPGVLGKLFSPKWVTRRLADRAIGERIVGKLRDGGILDDAEADFAEAVFGEDAAKFVRRQRILHRGAVILRQLPPAPEAAATQESQTGEGPPTRVTSEDWVNKAHEDIGLVDDEMLQEIYARILASESSKPGSVSMRTLAILRYLDREVAEAFARVQTILVDGFYIPQQRPGTERILHSAELNHELLLTLDDAGLVNAKAQSGATRDPRRVHVFRLSGYKRIVLVRRKDGAEFGLPQINVHVLTRAGRDLVRVADVAPDPTNLELLIEWLYDSAGRPEEVLTALLPHNDWTGSLDDLRWQEWHDDRNAGAT